MIRSDGWRRCACMEPEVRSLEVYGSCRRKILQNIADKNSDWEDWMIIVSCELDSWQCRIYIPFSLSLRLLGSLRGSLSTNGLTQKLS